MIELQYNLKNHVIVVTGAASGICASFAAQCTTLGAGAVLFLASENARLITGQTLIIDSGVSLAPMY